LLTKEQINSLKEELLARKEQLLLETSSSQTLIQELLEDHSSDETDCAEMASDSFNMNQVRNKQLEEIEDINLALEKIKNNTYGICDMCGANIGIRRLRIKPYARFCVDCRPIYERSIKK
jgi:DnaK suppressor protein